jgi:hypothetical protein
MKFAKIHPLPTRNSLFLIFKENIIVGIPKFVIVHLVFIPKFVIINVTITNLSPFV